MHSEKSNLLGRLIKESREKKKINQFELAKYLKVSAQYLGKVENGKVSIPDRHIVQAAKHLGIKSAVIKTIYLRAARKEAHILENSIRLNSLIKRSPKGRKLNQE